MSDIAVNVPGVASQIDVSACISPWKSERKSAISQWIDDVILITQLSASIMSGETSTVGQMLVATAVSSTENYFRTLFTDLVHNCPETARNLSSADIPYGAVRTFEPDQVGFGLVEGVLFSSKGAIAGQLKRFSRYKVSDGTPMQKAIAAFDSVCAIRHAAVHWSGRFDTRSHATLTPDLQRVGQQCLDLDARAVQDCLAACDFLVRLTNQTLFDLTLDRWLAGGYLGVDVPDGLSRDRARALSRTFAETNLRSSVTKKILALVAAS